mmetsp:Transcript_3704/g.8937  ORF Transcript_3704/g.8937 Transcript_3704/m.8937 type:complete len:210 (-) Transcript_3704:599-1228(-)
MFPMPSAVLSHSETPRTAPFPLVRPPPGLSLPQDSLLRPPHGLCEPLDLCGAWKRGNSGSDCSTTDASCSEPDSPRASDSMEELKCATTTSETEGSYGGYVPGRILQQSVAECNQVAVPLRLEDVVEPTTFGMPACPSVGSAGHWHGLCKPCDFFHRDRCTNGTACKYCHLCGSEESRRRRKQKRTLVKAAVRQQGGHCSIAVRAVAQR